jgi:hypothetical protein
MKPAWRRSFWGVSRSINVAILALPRTGSIAICMKNPPALAREAAGRLIEAERARGDSNAMIAAAESYLRKYPSGPHAGLARGVLKE